MYISSHTLTIVWCWRSWVVISRMKSYWRPVTSSVHQGSILGPTQFNVFINDPENGMACTLSKFTDDVKPGGVDDTPNGCADIQRDRLGTWTDRNLMKLSKMKCTIPQGNDCGTITSCLLVTIWKAALEKRTRGCWWTPSWTGDGSVPLWHRRLRVSWAALGKVLAAGWGRQVEGSKEFGARLFSVLSSKKTRGNGQKLKYRKFKLNIRIKKTPNLLFWELSNFGIGCPVRLQSLHP